MAQVLDRRLEDSWNYIDFQNNTLGESINPLILPGMG